MIVVLDAMGVIYKNGDDVAELLIPFVSQHSDIDAKEIEAQYLSASLGEITSIEFWRRMRVSADLESNYLNTFTLNSGAIEFLESMKAANTPVMALTNDVSEWSKLLRANFGLDSFISHWIVSGDVGCRKPSMKIYELVMEEIRKEFNQDMQIMFVDDRLHNLNSAAKIDWQTYYFSNKISNSSEQNSHIIVNNFAELTSVCKHAK